MSTSVTEDYSKIKSFAIFPPIGVARVGNSTDYYVGAEISGVYVGEGDTFFKFKDENNRVRPQAARFRIYGYDESGVVREIKLTDENENVKVKIVWTVTLANKKAAHTRFSGIKKYKIDNIKRNPSPINDKVKLIDNRLSKICPILPGTSDLSFRDPHPTNWDLNIKEQSPINCD
ncbi:10511_t:CDS:2 [Entrophospora sp. SA101]|nr:10511_t:CDS:2 [Entrophospora sp. SA101]